MDYEHLKAIISSTVSYNLLTIYVISLIYFTTYTAYDIYMFVELLSPHVDSHLILSLTWRTYSIAALVTIPVGIFIGVLAYRIWSYRFKHSNDILRYHLTVLLIFLATASIPLLLYLSIEGNQIMNLIQNTQIVLRIVLASAWYGFVGWIIWLVTCYAVDAFCRNVIKPATICTTNL